MRLEDKQIKKFREVQKKKVMTYPKTKVRALKRNVDLNNKSSSKKATQDLLNYLDRTQFSSNSENQREHDKRHKKSSSNTTKKLKKPNIKYKFSKANYKSKKPLYSYQTETIQKELEEDALKEMNNILKLILNSTITNKRDIKNR